MRPALLLALLGALPASAAPFAPSADEDEVIRALSVRHDPPPCDVLVAGLAEPARSLPRIAEEVPLPPWVGVRAAACAARLPSARARVLSWLASEDRDGLARAVLAALDTLPDEGALALAAAALAGPHAAVARARLAASARPPLRQLTEPR